MKPAQVRQLLLRISQKDEEAFNALFNFYYPKLIQIALAFVPGIVAAQEVISDLFYKILKIPRSLEKVNDFDNYIFLAVKNQCYTYLRKNNRRTIVDNVRFHHAKLMRKWLLTKDKLEIIYLPPYSPDLNPIERAWWYMRKKITHNRHLKSMKERKGAFWQMFSHFQKPNNELLKICEINY